MLQNIFNGLYFEDLRIFKELNNRRKTAKKTATQKNGDG
jgi:hypothetical protein